MRMILNKNYQLDYYLSCLNKDIKLKVIKHNYGPVFSTNYSRY